ncbi:hypothetical protein O7744_07125 [Corynebacterium pseudotuberculosis]
MADNALGYKRRLGLTIQIPLHHSAAMIVVDTTVCTEKICNIRADGLSQL